MNRSQSLAIAMLVVFSAFAAASPPALAQSGPAFAVTGKVVSDAGEPVEGALVHGFTDGPDGSARDRTMTGADGVFRLSLPAGKGQVYVEHHEWSAYESRDLSVQGNVSDVVFTLRAPPPKTAIVEGRVLDPEGKPVEGAHVRLEQACCYAYDDVAVAPTPSATPTTPPPSDPAPEGNATTASGGGSADSPGIVMERSIARPCCYDQGQSTVTGPDGAFRFATYGGPRQLYAEAKGYAQTTVRLDAKDNATVTKDVKLEKVPDADAVLKGRVLDAKTGAPIANVQVIASNLEWTRQAYATTGADGSYTLKALPGWTQVSVYAHSYGIPEPMPLMAEDDVAAPSVMKLPPVPGKGYYQYLHTLRLETGETTHDAKLEPKPEPTVVLQGYVVDPETKKGVPNANVGVSNQDTGDWGNAVTDATGSYKILVRPGHYVANAWAEGHLQAGATFVIEEGETLKRVDLTSPKGEPRYASCYDCYDGAMYGGVAYARMESDGAPDEATSTGSATVAKDASARPPAAPALAGGLDSGSNARGAAYVGGGGGLPAYSPETAAQPQTSDDVGTSNDAEKLEGAAPVPAPGALLALAAVALAALVLARRRA